MTSPALVRFLLLAYRAYRGDPVAAIEVIRTLRATADTLRRPEARERD